VLIMRRNRRTLVLGAALGAAIAYLTDPVSGRGRRTRLRDQGTAMLGRFRERVDAKRRYLEGVEQGMIAQTIPPSVEDSEPDDGTLEQRIRSQVFGAPDLSLDLVTLEVVDGAVTLRGQVDTRGQADELSTRVASVPGVRLVEILLHLPNEPAPNKESALQASHEAESTGDRTDR
jgi:osmotically-inducible protein OsmY